MSENKECDYLFKVLVIGDDTSGKTALLTRYTDSTFTDSYVSTIGVDFRSKTVELNGKNFRAQIWDTAGQERFQTITSSYYRGCHGAIIVYDVTNRSTFERVEHWIADLEHYGSGSVAKLLVGNKTDLDTERCVSYEEGRSVAVVNNMDYVETSAKTNSNVDEAFLSLYKEILKKTRQQAPQMENVMKMNAVGVRKEIGGVASGVESVASVNDESTQAFEKIIKEIEKINNRLGTLDTLETTVASMCKRLDNLEKKMSKFESRKVDFKSAQGKSAKPH